MVIINKEPLALAEISPYLKNLEDKKQMTDYIKRFTKLKEDQAKKLKEELRALNNPKIKETHIVKIIDLVPEDQEEINKIFTEVSLSQEEADAILEKVKGV